jgi:hypothetical protein
MSLSTIKIVVARYGENIEWTKKYDNVVIYNKGPPLNRGYDEIRLANVGREGHTYYTYICDNYDQLDDYTVFLQGHPFNHSPDIQAQLEAESDEEFQYLTPLTREDISDDDMPMTLAYEYLFDKPIDISSVQYGAGAQFIVSKTRILQRPRQFYERIVELLQHDVNPIEGYIVERFHGLIFE